MWANQQREQVPFTLIGLNSKRERESVCVCVTERKRLTVECVCHISETGEVKGQGKKVMEARQLDKSGRGQKEKIGREWVCWRTWWLLCKTKKKEKEKENSAHQLSLPCSHLTALETMWGKGLETQISPSLPRLVFTVTHLGARTHWRFLSVFFSSFFFSPRLSFSHQISPPLLGSRWPWVGERREERKRKKEEKKSKAGRERERSGWKREGKRAASSPQHMPPVRLE